ncbi:MAG TPA: hypothetical protein VJ742_13165 [Nitrososphaera sp.]|nr:hypothetical protein [Nitrososphaera sp.]
MARHTGTTETEPEAVNDEPEVEEEPPPWTMLPSGVPLFIGTVEHVIPWAEKQGYQVFFVLAQKEREVGAGPNKEIKCHPRLFKVVTNLIGRAISEVDELDLKLTAVNPAAWFSLPSIPYELIKDLDDFFRAVHAKHHTEAIVILTYDPNYRTKKDPKEGWGFLVPKQKNNAGHCQYDPQSVIDEKDDHVHLVGTAHSHPNMSAFASHTDVGDQADFDGLHITFGWMSSKNGGATEYHVELQMAGTGFKMQPEDVFADMPPPVENKRMSKYLERVEKESSSHSSSHGYGDYYQQNKQGTTTPPKRPEDNQNNWKFPEGCPTPKEAAVVVELVSAGETKCPGCNRTVTGDDFRRRRCSACLVYFALPGQTLEALINWRKSENFSIHDIDPSITPERAVYFWHRKAETPDGKGEITETVECEWEGRPGK